MFLDPIRFFSQCQASFIQKSDLETKIYSLTSSALITGIAYYASTIKPLHLRNIEPYKVVAAASIISWLFLSTIAGYHLQNQGTRS